MSVTPQDYRSWHNQSRWVSFVNGTPYTIPPHGVMRVTGYSGAALICDAPNSTQQAGYCFNGPNAVGAYNSGMCTFDAPAVAAAGSVFAANASAKVASGSFYLTSGGSIDAFKVLTGIDTGRVLVMPTATPTTNTREFSTFTHVYDIYGSSVSPTTSGSGISKTARLYFGDTAYLAFAKEGGTGAITHDPTESSPGTNGNFLVNTAGLYHVSIHYYITFTSIADRQDDQSWNTSEAGETVTLPLNGYEGLYCKALLYRTPSEALPALCSSLQDNLTGSSSLGYSHQLTLEVPIYLDVGDELYLECSVPFTSLYTGDPYTTAVSMRYPSIHFDRIGDSDISTI